MYSQLKLGLADLGVQVGLSTMQTQISSFKYCFVVQGAQTRREFNSFPALWAGTSTWFINTRADLAFEQ